MSTYDYRLYWLVESARVTLSPSLRSGWQSWTLLLVRNCQVHLNLALASC